MSTPELSALQMAVARMRVETKKELGEIASDVNVSIRTIKRWSALAAFKAYQEKVRAETDKKLEKQTDAVIKKLDFSKSDAVELLLKIAKAEAKMPTAGEQIKAIDMLAALLGWIPKPGAPDPADPDPPAKPDVYRAAWMRKPQ